METSQLLYIVGLPAANDFILWKVQVHQNVQCTAVVEEELLMNPSVL